jgi:hypothetical protein
MRHEGVVLDLAFSADGRRLLSGSADRSARLWDVTTCLPLSPPLRHLEAIFAVGLHPTGRTAFTNGLWRLPEPLPDAPPLVELWTQLATQRTFTAGDHVEWLDAATLSAAAEEFQKLAGESWREWAD